MTPPCRSRREFAPRTRAVRTGACIAAALATIALAAAPGPAAAHQPQAPQEQTSEDQQVVVIMRDGRRLSGALVEQGEETIRLRIAGVVVGMPRAEVERIVLQKPLLDRYRDMRRLADDGDVERLLLIAEWLRSVGLYDEAITELDHILTVDTYNERARRLRALVERQMALAEKSGNPRSNQQRPARETPPEAARPADSEPAQTSRQTPSDEGFDPKSFPLLDEEAINVIRVYEMDLRDPPRFVLRRETIEKLLTRYAGHPLLPTTERDRRAFFQKPPVEIVDLMFTLQARDLYGEIQVLEDPRPLKDFRDNVQRAWLVRNCATSGCHGDPNPSGLMLSRRRTAAPDGTYTNFLILTRHRTAAGEALLNFDTPADSLLLQMALPPNETARPHPEVYGWRPAFRSRDDRRYREAVEWIRGLYQPRAEYPIEYEPPTSAREAQARPEASQR